MAERLAVNQKVAGSSPAPRATIGFSDPDYNCPNCGKRDWEYDFSRSRDNYKVFKCKNCGHEVIDWDQKR